MRIKAPARVISPTVERTKVGRELPTVGSCGFSATIRGVGVGEGRVVGAGV